jgi:hypothetical protein
MTLFSESKLNRNLSQPKEKLSPKEEKFIKEFEETIEFVNLHQPGKC